MFTTLIRVMPVLHSLELIDRTGEYKLSSYLGLNILIIKTVIICHILRNEQLFYLVILKVSESGCLLTQ